MLRKTFGTVSTLQQECLASTHASKLRREFARLSGEHQWGKRQELSLYVSELRCIRIFGHLRDGLHAPFVGRPPGIHAAFLHPAPHANRDGSCPGHLVITFRSSSIGYERTTLVGMPKSISHKVCSTWIA